jgi:hypothetical protein
MLLIFGMLVRGFSIMAFLAPLLAYVIWFQARKRQAGLAIVTTVSVLIGLSAVAFFQWKTTGNPLVPGYVLEDPVIYGFGKNILQQVHTPLRGLENISNDLLGLNYWLNGWFCGSLVFIIVFILFGKWKIWDRLLMISCFAVFGFYYFFLFQDLVIGPRYIYPIAPIALLFVARSILIPISKQGTPFFFLLFLFSLLTYLPFRLPAFVHMYEPSNTQAGALKKAIQSTDTRPKVVFLEKNISQQFVNWNDPWLRDTVVLLRDLGPKNVEPIKIFSKRELLYFGLKINLDAARGDDGYRFRLNPSKRSPEFISLMEVALAMSVSQDYPDRDFFDIAFPIFLDGTRSDEQLNFLDKELRVIPVRQRPSTFFKRGLIHSAKMMLLLKQTYEKTPSDWSAAFPHKEFRRSFSSAKECFEKASEPGKQLMSSIQKVQRRIDRSGDHYFSDQELNRYLNTKIKLLELSDDNESR